MSGIEIDKKPVIFDDKIWCNSESERCFYMSGFMSCDLFPFKLYKHNLTHYPSKSGGVICEKHDECKVAWKKAKEIKEQTKTWRCTGCSYDEHRKGPDCDKLKSTIEPDQCQYGPYPTDWEQVNG